MIDVLAAAAAEATHTGGGLGWQWIPGLVGGGGVVGVIVMLAKQKLFTGTFRIGGGAGGEVDGGNSHPPCPTVLRLQQEHDSLVKDVGTMKGDLGMVKGGINLLVQLKTGKPLEESVAQNKQPPTQ